jgi:RNA polymerase sigma-70 factor, ECF subfamily
MGKTLKPLSKRKLDVIKGELTVAHDDFKGALLRRAQFKTSDREVSEDLVQTTFLKTLLYLQRGGKIDMMRSFLNHVLGDLIIDEYRYRKNKVISLDTLMESGYEPSSSYEEKNISVLDGQGVVVLIPKLAPKYELVIRMRYLQGLSLKEMALITNQTQNTVAVQVHRGLIKLRKLYDEQTQQ